MPRIISADAARSAIPVQSLPGRMRRWELWSVPARGAAFALMIEMLAGAGTVLSLATTTVTTTIVWRTLALAALAIAYDEASRRIERIRDYLHVADTKHVGTTPTSVWTFPAALLLPAGYAATVILLIHAHMLVLGYRQKTVRPYRVIFGWAATTSGAFAVAGLRHWAHTVNLLDGGPLTTVTAATALLLYTATSLLIVLTGSRLFRPGASWQAVLPRRSDFAFEGATLTLGLLTAELLLHQPGATPAGYILVAMLHRSTMISELQTAAVTDSKTGLLNHHGWQQLAQRHLLHASRTHQPASIALLDLDFFKTFNDRYGHPAGDAVLAAVADCLKHELRGYDAVGRYGGEEFIVLFPDTEIASAHAIAQRLRTRIAELRFDDLIDDNAGGPRPSITTSIGLAAYPDHGSTLSALTAAADRALYAAKHASRNCVRVARSGT